MQFLINENEMVTLADGRAFIVLKCFEYNSEAFYLLNEIEDDLNKIFEKNQKVEIAKQILNNGEVFVDIVNDINLKERLIEASKLKKELI